MLWMFVPTSHITNGYACTAIFSLLDVNMYFVLDSDGSASGDWGSGDDDTESGDGSC